MITAISIGRPYTQEVWPYHTPLTLPEMRLPEMHRVTNRMNRQFWGNARWGTICGFPRSEEYS